MASYIKRHLQPGHVVRFGVLVKLLRIVAQREVDYLKAIWLPLLQVLFSDPFGELPTWRTPDLGKVDCDSLHFSQINEYACVLQLIVLVQQFVT